MASSQIEAIVHPVRLRILMDIGGRERTPHEIQKALPDVSQASLYRHINRLLTAGVLKVTRETPVRGAVEKVYALADAQAANIDRAKLADISREDHLRYFTGFVSALLGQFRLYLQNETVDFDADGAGYRTEALNLSPDEEKAFRQTLRDLLASAMENPPSPERRRSLLSLIQMPAPESKEKENRQDEQDLQD